MQKPTLWYRSHMGFKGYQGEGYILSLLPPPPPQSKPHAKERKIKAPYAIQSDFTSPQEIMLINVNSTWLRAILQDTTISDPLLCSELFLCLVRNCPQKHFCIRKGLCTEVKYCHASTFSKTINLERKNPYIWSKSMVKYFLNFRF